MRSKAFSRCGDRNYLCTSHAVVGFVALQSLRRAESVTDLTTIQLQTIQTKADGTLDAIIESPEGNTEFQSAVRDILQASGDALSTFQRLAAEEPAVADARFPSNLRVAVKMVALPEPGQRHSLSIEAFAQVTGQQSCKKAMIYRTEIIAIVSRHALAEE